MSNSLKYHAILQANVLLWGLTGILGNYIVFENGDLGISDSTKIVFFRTLLASISLIIIGLLIKKGAKIPFSQILVLLGVGVIIAAHWFAFFYSIKVSTVSIAVVCMSMMAFFTAIIEPIVTKRKILASEIILGIVSVVGMGLIFGFEISYINGILWGLLCAMLAAVFTIMNASLTKKHSTVTVAKYEMLGAMLTSAIALLIFGDLDSTLFQIEARSWLYILILGLLCTTVAFLVGVWLIKYVSPFTFSISLNLEPVYTIIIVLIIDAVNGTNTEQMTAGFYAGGSVVVLAVFLNAYLKHKKADK